MRSGLLALMIATPTLTGVMAGACSTFGSDDPTPSEAGTEAIAPPPTSSDGGSSFCKDHTSATICSDFDDSMPFGSWKVVKDPAADLGFDSELYESSPQSMLSRLHGGRQSARLTTTIKPGTPRVKLSFDVQLGSFTLTDVPTAEGIQGLSIGEIYCGGTAAPPYDGVWIFIQGAAQALVARHTEGSVATPLSPPAAHKWTHIVIDADFEKGTTAVTSGETTLADLPMPTDCGTATKPVFEARVGLSTNTQAEASVYYDNVLYEVLPRP